MTLTNIAIVGLGKIARDQHVPSITQSNAFTLGATVSRNATQDGVQSYSDLDVMLAERSDITAVSLCVPPQVRYEMARAALMAGRDVMLEKPPGASLSEVAALSNLATHEGCALFATWHSRFAQGVPAAKAWLADRTILGGQITWHEDVRHWHPGQGWIWQAGGLGVFDPGINALSILTEILPQPVHMRDAVLEFPVNRDTPIAATLQMATPDGTAIGADFDWRITGEQIWTIEVQTDAGTLHLSKGGAQVDIPAGRLAAGAALRSEYDGVYARFADLVQHRRSEVDIAPLRLVADAYMLGRRLMTDAFHD